MARAVVIVLSIVATLLLGGVIAVLVETARARARRAGVRPGAAGSGRAVPSHAGPSHAGSSALLRESLRGEVVATKAAVERAAGVGVPVGQLDEVVAAITAQAARLDDQLAFAGRSPATQSSSALLAQLRDNHDGLVAVTQRIRADLAEAEVRQSSTELGDTLFRARHELDLLRGADVRLESRIAEVEAEYRRQIADRPEQQGG